MAAPSPNMSTCGLRIVALSAAEGCSAQGGEEGCETEGGELLLDTLSAQLKA